MEERLPPATDPSRVQLAWLITAVPAAIVALTQTGFLFELPFAIGVAIVIVGALGAGVVRGRDVPSRAAFAGAFLLAGQGISLATVWYTAGSSSVINYELAIPGIGGAIPKIGAYWILARWDARRR